MKLFFSFLFVIFLSCDNMEAKNESSINETVHSNATDTIVTDAPVIFLAGDYEMASGNDTAKLTLLVKDTTVTGIVSFSDVGKVKSEGQVSGAIKDSVLWLDFAFSSEGVTSTREEAFLMRPDTLVRGVGARVEKAGKQSFLDKSRLKYDFSQIFTKKKPLFR